LKYCKISKANSSGKSDVVIPVSCHGGTYDPTQLWQARREAARKLNERLRSVLQKCEDAHASLRWRDFLGGWGMRSDVLENVGWMGQNGKHGNTNHSNYRKPTILEGTEYLRLAMIVLSRL
jgi:hypothetical protein